MNSETKRPLEDSNSDDDDDYSGDEHIEVVKRVRRTEKVTLPNAYIDEINIKRLDFDKERICCVTLSRSNIYCCLSCGKYLQGRGRSTVMFKHSIEQKHHVFLNVTNLKVYLLPEGSEVETSADPLLRDILYAVYPTFTAASVKEFPKVCRDLDDRAYLNGFIGLNDLNSNGYMNVVILALSHIPPLRDHFLLSNKYSGTDSPVDTDLTASVALVVKKLWNCRLLRRNVSPQQLMNVVSSVSKTKFSSDAHEDPRLFLLWLLSKLSTNGDDRILQKTLMKQLQGQIEIKSTEIETITNEADQTVKFKRLESESTIKKTKFWLLSLDLPEMKVFKDGNDVNSVPQVRIEELLSKYTEQMEHHTKDSVKTYKVVKYPNFLILYYNRFNNGFTSLKDRNQTIVEFSNEMDFQGNRYRLLSNITHDCITKGKLSDTEDLLVSKWKINVLNTKDNYWYEIDDIEIRKVEEEFIFLKECYIQIWQRL